MNRIQVHFVLVDLNDHPDIFNYYFSQYDNWSYFWNAFEKLRQYDCLVTPGNSYGDMTGGFDLSVVGLLGDDIQKKVRGVLSEKFPSGESTDEDDWDYAMQPIGTSILIKTESSIVPYLCHTPTMEYVRNITGKPNVYMAMNSILFEILKHNEKCLKTHSPSTDDNKNIYTKIPGYINTVVMPFLGTGFGELTYAESAEQMISAYRFFTEHYPQYFN